MFAAEVHPSVPLYSFVTDREALESAELHPVADAAGKQYMLQHPDRFLQLQGIAIWQMAKGVGYHSAWQQSGSKWVAMLLAGIQLLFNGLMLMALLAGLWQWRGLPQYNTLLLFVIGVFVMLHAAIWADGRYRMIADPCFVLLLPNLFITLSRLAARGRYRFGRQQTS